MNNFKVRDKVKLNIEKLIKINNENDWGLNWEQYSKSIFTISKISMHLIHFKEDHPNDLIYFYEDQLEKYNDPNIVCKKKIK